MANRAAGSTDTTSRKSANEEKMFWKVTLSSALIFFCKTMIFAKLTLLFFLSYLHLKQCEKCFSDGGSHNCS